MPYKRIDVIQYTETVILDDERNEIERFENGDGHWYDLKSEDYITEDEAQEYL